MTHRRGDLSNMLCNQVVSSPQFMRFKSTSKTFTAIESGSTQSGADMTAFGRDTVPDQFAGTLGGKRV